MGNKSCKDCEYFATCLSEGHCTDESADKSCKWWKPSQDDSHEHWPGGSKWDQPIEEEA